MKAVFVVPEGLPEAIAKEFRRRWNVGPGDSLVMDTDRCNPPAAWYRDVESLDDLIPLLHHLRLASSDHPDPQAALLRAQLRLAVGAEQLSPPPSPGAVRRLKVLD